MNHTTRKKNARVLWIFSFLIVGVLANIYAAQVEFTALLIACNIMMIILSLGLLFFLLQAYKTVEKNENEIIRLRQREKDRLQRLQQTTEESRQQQETFRCDEKLAQIMPAAGTDFDSVAAYTENLLQNIAKEMEIVMGLVFVLSDADQMFHMSGQYAYYSEERPKKFSLGETLSGQVAKNRKLLNIKEIPEGYITVFSGLGNSAPRHLIIAPISYNYQCIGIIELASFKPFGENEETLVRNICESMAPLLNELKN